MKWRPQVRLRQGLIAEFSSPEQAAGALRELSGAGYGALDAFLPYPDERVIEALPGRRSPIPAVMLAAGLGGGALAYLIQWWTNAVDWGLRVGGKPIHSVPSMVPIVFETTILCASFAGVIAFLVLSRMPRLWHPLFEVPGWESAAIDRFWVGVDAADPMFDADRTESDLRNAGAARVLRVGEAP